MALEVKAGQTVKIKVSKMIRRDSARKTIERLFLQDKALRAPLDARSANFIPLPKRRGGCIWTKYPNKIHTELGVGATATIKLTAQSVRDLKSVDDFVEIA